ncbi:MAG: copper resistance protein B [Hyphomonadaceae bacterium]
MTPVANSILGTAALVLVCAPVALAQPSMPGMAHAQHQHTPAAPVPEAPHSAPAGEVGHEPPPPVPTDRAADVYFDPAQMQAARAHLEHGHGHGVFSKVMLTLAEHQARDGEDGYRWEGEAWIGGDRHRLVIKSQGEGATRSGVEAAEAQLLYSRAMTPYFDLQAGLRQDLTPGRNRAFAALGLEGVAPYWIDVAAAVFIADHGDVLGRLEGAYDLRLTQRLILQPRMEANLAARDAPENHIGAGVSNVEFGLRLRYEIARRFAPYIGVSFDRKVGATADYARAAGEDPSVASLVVGLRAWF